MSTTFDLINDDDDNENKTSVDIVDDDDDFNVNNIEAINKEKKLNSIENSIKDIINSIISINKNIDIYFNIFNDFILKYKEYALLLNYDNSEKKNDVKYINFKDYTYIFNSFLIYYFENFYGSKEIDDNKFNYLKEIIKLNILEDSNIIKKLEELDFDIKNFPLFVDDDDFKIIGKKSNLETIINNFNSDYIDILSKFNLLYDNINKFSNFFLFYKFSSDIFEDSNFKKIEELKYLYLVFLQKSLKYFFDYIIFLLKSKIYDNQKDLFYILKNIYTSFFEIYYNFNKNSDIYKNLDLSILDVLQTLFLGVVFLFFNKNKEIDSKIIDDNNNSLDFDVQYGDLFDLFDIVFIIFNNFDKGIFYEKKIENKEIKNMEYFSDLNLEYPIDFIYFLAYEMEIFIEKIIKQSNKFNIFGSKKIYKTYSDFILKYKIFENLYIVCNNLKIKNKETKIHLKFLDKYITNGLEIIKIQDMLIGYVNQNIKSDNTLKSFFNKVESKNILSFSFEEIGTIENIIRFIKERNIIENFIFNYLNNYNEIIKKYFNLLENLKKRNIVDNIDLEDGIKNFEIAINLFNELFYNMVSEITNIYLLKYPDSKIKDKITFFESQKKGVNQKIQNIKFSSSRGGGFGNENTSNIPPVVVKNSNSLNNPLLSPQNSILPSSSKPQQQQNSATSTSVPVQAVQQQQQQQGSATSASAPVPVQAVLQQQQQQQQNSATSVSAQVPAQVPVQTAQQQQQQQNFATSTSASVPVQTVQQQQNSATSATTSTPSAVMPTSPLSVASSSATTPTPSAAMPTSPLATASSSATIPIQIVQQQQQQQNPTPSATTSTPSVVMPTSPLSVASSSATTPTPSAMMPTSPLSVTSSSSSTMPTQTSTSSINNKNTFIPYIGEKLSNEGLKKNLDENNIFFLGKINKIDDLFRKNVEKEFDETSKLYNDFKKFIEKYVEISKNINSLDIYEVNKNIDEISELIEENDNFNSIILKIIEKKGEFDNLILKENKNYLRYSGHLQSFLSVEKSKAKKKEYNNIIDKKTESIIKMNNEQSNKIKKIFELIKKYRTIEITKTLNILNKIRDDLKRRNKDIINFDIEIQQNIIDKKNSKIEYDEIMKNIENTNIREIQIPFSETNMANFLVKTTKSNTPLIIIYRNSIYIEKLIEKLNIKKNIGDENMYCWGDFSKSKKWLDIKYKYIEQENIFKKNIIEKIDYLFNTIKDNGENINNNLGGYSHLFFNELENIVYDNKYYNNENYTNNEKNIMNKILIKLFNSMVIEWAYKILKEKIFYLKQEDEISKNINFVEILDKYSNSTHLMFEIEKFENEKYKKNDFSYLNINKDILNMINEFILKNKNNKLFIGCTTTICDVLLTISGIFNVKTTSESLYNIPFSIDVVKTELYSILSKNSKKYIMNEIFGNYESNNDVIEIIDGEIILINTFEDILKNNISNNLNDIDEMLLISFIKYRLSIEITNKFDEFYKKNEIIIKKIDYNVSNDIYIDLKGDNSSILTFNDISKKCGISYPILLSDLLYKINTMIHYINNVKPNKKQRNNLNGEFTLKNQYDDDDNEELYYNYYNNYLDLLEDLCSDDEKIKENFYFYFNNNNSETMKNDYNNKKLYKNKMYVELYEKIFQKSSEILLLIQGRMKINKKYGFIIGFIIGICEEGLKYNDENRIYKNLIESSFLPKKRRYGEFNDDAINDKIIDTLKKFNKDNRFSCTWLTKNHLKAINIDLCMAQELIFFNNDPEERERTTVDDTDNVSDHYISKTLYSIILYSKVDDIINICLDGILKIGDEYLFDSAIKIGEILAKENILSP